MARFNYCKVIAGTTEAKPKSKEAPVSQYEIAGDVHILDRSLMISPHRISAIIYSIETRIIFSAKKL